MPTRSFASRLGCHIYHRRGKSVKICSLAGIYDESAVRWASVHFANKKLDRTKENMVQGAPSVEWSDHLEFLRVT